MKTWINGEIVDLSADEIAKIEAERKEWNDASATRKLAKIKKLDYKNFLKQIILLCQIILC